MSNSEVQVQVVECRNRGMGAIIKSIGFGGVALLSRRLFWIDLDQRTILALNLKSSEFLEVHGATHLIMVSPRALNHPSGVRITATLGKQLGVSSGDFITLRKVVVSVAKEIQVAPISAEGTTDILHIKQFIAQKLMGEPLFVQDFLHIPVENGEPLVFQVRSTLPSGIVTIQNGTVVEVQDPSQASGNPLSEEEMMKQVQELITKKIESFKKSNNQKTSSQKGGGI